MPLQKVILFGFIIIILFTKNISCICIYFWKKKGFKLWLASRTLNLTAIIKEQNWILIPLIEESETRWTKDFSWRLDSNTEHRHLEMHDDLLLPWGLIQMVKEWESLWEVLILSSNGGKNLLIEKKKKRDDTLNAFLCSKT